MPYREPGQVVIQSSKLFDPPIKLELGQEFILRIPDDAVGEPDFAAATIEVLAVVAPETAPEVDVISELLNRDTLYDADVKEILDGITAERRVEFFAALAQLWCPRCGRKLDSSVLECCHCENDE